MAAQKGKDLLLKVDADGAAASSRSRACARARSPSTRRRSTSPTESAGRWRELLAGAGVKTARISGSGIFKDAASDETVRGYFFDGTIRDWQVVVPDFGTVEGPFQIAALEYAGQHDGEVAFELGARNLGRRARSLHAPHDALAWRIEASWPIGTAARSKPCSTARATAVPDARRARRARSSVRRRRHAGARRALRGRAAHRARRRAHHRRGPARRRLRLGDEAVAAMRAEGGAAGFVDIVARLLAATFRRGARGGERPCRRTAAGGLTEARRAVSLGRRDGGGLGSAAAAAGLLGDDAARARRRAARRARRSASAMRPVARRSRRR